MSSDVILVRHTEVALRWKRRCYGCSDVGLSRAGRRQANELAVKLAHEPITAIVCSGLTRAQYLAERLAALTNLEPVIDVRWRERDFGKWEGRTWNAIWRDTGNAMDGMLTHPHDFRPGGGETTTELATRALSAWDAVPRTGLVVVITHGGPIAAIRASLDRASITAIADFRIPEGAVWRQPVAAASSMRSCLR